MTSVADTVLYRAQLAYLKLHKYVLSDCNISEWQASGLRKLYH